MAGRVGKRYDFGTRSKKKKIVRKWVLRNFHAAQMLECIFNTLNAELNPICYLLALLAHHFLHVSRIRVKSLTLRLLMSYIYIYIYSAFKGLNIHSNICAARKLCKS